MDSVDDEQHGTEGDPVSQRREDRDEHGTGETDHHHENELTHELSLRSGADIRSVNQVAVGTEGRYLVLLFSHVVLAATVPVLAITLITLGLRGRIDRHRRLARWAWPIWMYVSVTGVAIYMLLYQLNPAPRF